MKVPLERVERELGRLWEEEAKKTRHNAHASLLTLVALVTEPRLAARTDAVLASIVQSHPCRTITVAWLDDGDPSIEADVSLHANPDRGGEACGDAIALVARGEAKSWLPSNVDRLLLGGLPACVWWVGDLPDHDDLFERVVRRFDVVIVNSSEMDLRDLEKLSQIADASRDYWVGDLTWVRLRGLQELIARFFDDPAARGYLDGLSRVTLAYSPRANETDVASTRVGLLIGWLATTLGLKPETAKWTRDAKSGEVTLQRATGASPVVIRVEHDKRENVHEGAITSVCLSCVKPDGARGEFRIERQAEESNVVWSCDAPGVLLPSQTLRFGSHDETRLLRRFLERPSRDPLLERSLRDGYRVVQPVAPRFSMRPPR